MAIAPASVQATKPTTPPVAAAPRNRPSTARRIDPPDERQDEKHREHLEGFTLRPGLRFRRCGQRLPVDHAHHAVDPRVDADIELAFPEARHDDVADDALRRGVIEDALKAVADLDAQRAVILGDHENGAVVDLLAADFPLLGDAQRELLDWLRCGGRDQEHGKLAAFPRLEFLQRALQPGVLLAGQRARLVHHAPGERWHGDLRPGEPERKQEQLHRDLIYFLPKSTFGALPISRSFSTVKLGLVLKPKTIAVRFDGKERTVTL